MDDLTTRPTYQILTISNGHGQPTGYAVQVEYGDGSYATVTDGLFWTYEAADARLRYERASARIDFSATASPRSHVAHETHQEAPCSINAHLDIQGLRVQITGRGTTPAEAAHNFQGTLAAMQPAPEVKSLHQRVGDVLVHWLGKAAGRGDFGMVERLSKGAALVLAGMVEPGNSPTEWAVRSATSPETWYSVTLADQKSCTCQDYVCHARKGQPEHACTHLCAAALWQRRDA